MGRILTFLCFASFFVSGCLPKSNFDKEPEALVSTTGGETNGGTTVVVPTDIVVEDVATNPVTSATNRSSVSRPKVSGSIVGTAGYVFLYSGSKCINKIGEGSAADFENAALGITATVASSTETKATINTSIYIRTATDKNAVKSPCPTSAEAIYYYTNESPIKFVRANAESPTKSDGVRIWGKVDNSAIKTISFFKDDDCTQSLLANVNVEDFDEENFSTAAGVRIPLVLNATTHIYAKGFGPSYASASCNKIKSYIHDDTAPTMTGTLTHAKFTTTASNKSPAFTWPAATDSGVGVDHYLYAIGANAGGAGILSWTKAEDNNTPVVVSSASFTENQDYFITVKAVDKLGNTSTPLPSSKWTVRAELPALTIQSPVNNSTTASRTLSVTGACVPGIQVKVKQNINNATEVAVACSNYDYAATLVIEGDAGVKEIQVRQVDDSYTDTKTRFFNFSPLSPYGQSIAAGSEHTCGMKGEELFCWGKGDSGRLGDTGQGENPIPRRVSKGYLPANHTYVHTTAGLTHSCALSSERKAYCWGSNINGALGTNGPDVTTFAAPVEMGNVEGRNFIQISAGSYHTCAITADHKAYCWGLNSDGQLGTGNKEKSETPKEVYPVGKMKQISAGHRHTCALMESGNIFCWGENANGQLGLGTNTQTSYPRAILRSGQLTNGDEVFTYVSAGNYQSCAVTNRKNVFCWGHNANGALGTGNLNSTNKITQKANPADIDFVKVSTSGGINSNYQTTCGITSNHKVYCWGLNNYSQLGIGSTVRHSVPKLVTSNFFDVSPTAGFSAVYIEINASVLATSNLVTDISVGGSHTCARTSNDKSYCWGNYRNGRLGIAGKDSNQQVPGRVDYP